MASKYALDITLNDLPAEHFIALAVEAANGQGWTVMSVAPTGFTATAPFSMRSWGEKIQVTATDGKAHLNSECTRYQKIDWGKNKKNITSLLAAVDQLKRQYTPGQLAERAATVKDELFVQPVLKNTSQASSPDDKFTSVLSIFVPVKGYVVTPILLLLNVAIFIIMAFSGVHIFEPTSQSLLQWGANFRPLTLDGEWWRLISSCFLHIGVIHLLMNMIALVYIGVLLEPRIGAQRFLVAYLLTGIISGITSIYWHALTVSAGASGAIFGMYGLFLALLTTNLVEKKIRGSLLTSMAVFVGYNLVYGLQGGIDNSAHVGGLLSGFITGYIFYPSLKKPGSPSLKYGTIALVAVLATGLSFAVYNKLPNDTVRYDALMKEFSAAETKALEIYQLSGDAPAGQVMSAIQNDGLPNWNKSIGLLREADQLDVPAKFHERNKKLIEYCNLRIKSYALMYKAISGNTDAYNDSLEYYNNQIGTMLERLKGN